MTSWARSTLSQTSLRCGEHRRASKHFSRWFGPGTPLSWNDARKLDLDVFKARPNFAGDTEFVHPAYVTGTLRKGFEMYRSV